MIYDDETAWKHLASKDLWIYDKLIVAKMQGMVAGPSGVRVPEPGKYMVKPITNLEGMDVKPERCG